MVMVGMNFFHILMYNLTLDNSKTSNVASAILLSLF